MQNLNLNALITKANYHRPFIFNSVLWSLTFVILLFIFSKGNTPYVVDFIYTIAFIVVLAIPVSINFYILIPRLLKHENYTLYSFFFVLNLIVFSLLSSWLLEPLLDLIFPTYFFISYLSRPNILLIFTIVLIGTTLIKLAEDWFYFNSKENIALKVKNQQIETQLSALRAQINPHFLFNSLNVIYALALEKKEGVSNAIIQLSDILRYVIYDSDVERVTLKDEIKLLKNYIAFQNHRIEIPNATDFDINIDDEQFKIYPMILLPLLENSYKHGIISGETKIPVSIKLYQDKNEFHYTITNANLNTKNTIEDRHSGIGIENIKNNLNLVYPNQHQFAVEETKDVFKVTLTITNEL